METSNVFRPNRDRIFANQPAPMASAPSSAKPKLLDQVRQAIRTRHYSYMTEKAYVGWIKRFIFFHNKRHPAQMAEAEIAQFLSSLACDSHVSASTQNQALNALLFLYHEVLGQEIGYVAGVVRAKRPNRLPVVLTRQEVKTVLSLLCGTDWIMATLLYGAGMRLIECMRLRVKDIDFCGQGDKDRPTMLPASVKESPFKHLEWVRARYKSDLESGFDGVSSPYALQRKYPNAAREWGWQWVFPASRLYVDRVTGAKKKHHLHESVLQKAVKDAVQKRGYPNRQCATVFAIRSPLTCLKTVTTFAQFRNSWATKT